MKHKVWLLFGLVLGLIIVAGCGADSAGSVAEEVEHMEEDHDHVPAEHVAAMHDVPEDAAAVPNPQLASAESVQLGATLFAANCAVCHGERGLGDGPTAETLEMRPADLTAPHVQQLSDGALFYIVSHGRPETPMPAWEGVLTEDERWHVVNYLRTLAEGEHDDEHQHMDEPMDDHMDEHEDDHMHEPGGETLRWLDDLG